MGSQRVRHDWATFTLTVQAGDHSAIPGWGPEIPCPTGQLTLHITTREACTPQWRPSVAPPPPRQFFNLNLKWWGGKKRNFSSSCWVLLSSQGCENGPWSPPTLFNTNICLLIFYSLSWAHFFLKIILKDLLLPNAQNQLKNWEG